MPGSQRSSRRGSAATAATPAAESSPPSRARLVGTPSRVPAGSATVAPAARTDGAAAVGCTRCAARPSSVSNVGSSGLRARNASAPTSKGNPASSTVRSTPPIRSRCSTTMIVAAGPSLDRSR